MQGVLPLEFALLEKHLDDAGGHCAIGVLRLRDRLAARRDYFAQDDNKEIYRQAVNDFAIPKTRSVLISHPGNKLANSGRVSKRIDLLNSCDCSRVGFESNPRNVRYRCTK